MNVWSRAKNLFRNLSQKQQVESQLDEELSAYVDIAVKEKIAAGIPASEARRITLAEFGGIEQVKQAVRDHRAGTRLERLSRDISFGLRQLRRNPGFTATAILTLALSIGANTAIFSVVNALMLKSLPYSQPERMGTIYTRITGTKPSDERHHINGEQWVLLRDNVPALISAASGIRASGVNVQAGSNVEYVHNARISAHYFDVLAIQPALGRNFTEDEDRPHGPKSAILSDNLWRSLFGADRNLIGKTILLKGETYTVVGVLPPDITTPSNADIYTSLQAARDGEGGGTNFEAITRLRDGATWQEADAEINRSWLKRASRYELEDDPGAQVTYYSVPLQKGQAAALRPQALTLLLATGLILLIACANLAGLTLVHMMRRIPEIATRLALGASRWQIQQQFWIENLLLAIGGGVAGICVGYVGLRCLLQLLPDHFLPVAHVPLDGRVLAFTLILSLCTSVLFGMLPTLVIRKVDLRSSMAQRSLGGNHHQRVRQALIIAEVSFTVVLLAASGLLIRTLIHLETLPPGFNPNGVMTAKASLDDIRFHDPVTFQKLLSESTAAMRQIPGVQDAAVGLALPYERSVIMGGITIGDGKEIGQKAMADQIYVTPGYFSTLQIPVLSGRSFTEADDANTQHVAIVNQAFVRKFFHGANPVGRHLNLRDTMIVGVVADVSMAPGIDVAAPLAGEETIYIPATQVAVSLLSMVHVWFQPSWIVRTAAPVEGLTAQMQRALATSAPNLPFSGFYSMRDLQTKTLATQRVEVALLSAMAGLALLLSAVGIFALVASMVGQKTREIGIRLALGSTIRQAMLHIGAPGIESSGFGLILGLILCAGALRVMHSVLYGVGVYDLTTILAVAMILAVVTAIASIVPILRISSIDPATTLREE
ncbi:ABC transporter permease [Acidicapsa acidisoli]|uniref:ABC transporter permease n=1 Tax=Acidicapsa acidisoli TaxID=1615681 RepID=UPI0021E0DF28|nr:ABC transporter permease [Acidicapsa acidisoli]